MRSIFLTVYATCMIAVVFGMGCVVFSVGKDIREIWIDFKKE
jgi:hypothetical protein